MIFEEHSHFLRSTSWPLVIGKAEQASVMASEMSGRGQSKSDDTPLTDDEKFELLSAYLDSEVTEEEQCLVEHWIASDPDMKNQYEKQLKLRAAIKAFWSDMS